jgi:hypothetical protein
MKHSLSAALAAACALAAILVSGVPASSQALVCRGSPNIPLTDLTSAYRGLDVGLYPGKRNTPPDDHLAIGLERATKGIRPLDANGKPAANGRIILMALGMSNTSSEFARFVADARANRAINRQLTILNASLSGSDAARWTDRDSFPWKNAVSMASAGSLSPNQVQVIWIKQAHLRTAAFPQEVELFKANLQRMIDIASGLFPNLQIVYLSSRTRAGTPSRQGPGEPQAYETAFGVRRVIEEHMAARRKSGAGGVWLSWGPYLWANDAKRSDGLVWECGDLQADTIHPTASGDKKVADQLMAFFMSAETAAPWFLEPSLANRGPKLGEIAASFTSGPTPLTVKFSAAVSGATQYFWTFEDGTFSTAASPEKTFHIDGLYNVQLTVIDASGNWARGSVAVRAGKGN